MTAYQLRTYTIEPVEDAERYAEVHWERHARSLAEFGITTEGWWRAGDTTVVALVRYGDGVDPAEADRAFMASDAFRADMAGFPMASIRHVEAVRLESVAGSPLS